MLKTLRRIIQEVTNAQDFRGVLDTVVRCVSEALSTDACSVFLWDRRSGEYVLMATNGLNPKAIGQIRIPLNQGLVGLVGEREETLNISDATTHPRFLRVPIAEEDSYRAFLGAPMIYHRQVVGVLIVQQREPRRYDESEEAFLITLAAQLAAIIAHAEVMHGAANLFDLRPRENRDNAWAGIPGAPGVGIGQGVVISYDINLATVPDREPEDIESEIRLLEAALELGREEFRVLGERLYSELPLEERELLKVYQYILETSDLGDEIIHHIRQGQWAQGALRKVIESHATQLENSDNHYLRERAADIRALGQRVLTYLQRNERTLPDYADKTILIGEELTAADLAEVPEGCLVGVISAKGSGSSHLAILARAMGIPTVMGVTEVSMQSLHSQEIIVDGYFGQIYVNPSDALRAEFQKLADEERRLMSSLESLRDQSGKLADDEPVSLMVNTGLGVDVSLSLAAGAEGVGLYRTEIPFLMRDRFPSGEEQRVIYRQLLASFAPRMVTMRTLDIGGDKSLSYFPVHEENPFLGWRGIRITLDHPDIFLTQVRAMMRASRGYNNLRIMLPMITDVSEVDEALRLLKKAHAEVLETYPDIVMPQVGVMIEVPAAVWQARAIAKRVDFLSVGSNDLTQYILAVDRNNARVATLFDSLHPSVLRALLLVVEASHQEGKHVSICGELAGDPIAVMLLIAMGFDSLSMSASSLSRIKWVIRHFTRKEACQLLQDVLQMENAIMIRCRMALALEKAGLGELVRAGKRG
ncbi:MAG: phosphoenolpyruvate--protein phosphotransferase [Gammaproteobacteria bacterium]|nr:phosphoenolpyruvate--protein phosphotransferase [Gammaproteobacteria bacterium]